MKLNKFIPLLLLCSALSNQTLATEAVPSTDYAALDAEFFQKAFNECNIAFMKSRVSSDLRFYHDVSGVQDKQEFIQASLKNLCTKENKPIRKLRGGTLKSIELKDNGRVYAVLQKGTHDFYLRNEGKKDVYTGTAEFDSIWRKQDGQWLLETVFSYNHRAENKD